MKEFEINLTEVTVSRTIPARAEEVYDVWIDPNSPGGPWFGAHKAIVNPVVDGLFYNAVLYEGKNWAHYGRFLRMERPACVENTWVSPATKGLESIVTVTFEARGEQTEVTLRHSGIPDDDMGRQHKEGWAWVLSMLEQRFSAAAATL